MNKTSQEGSTMTSPINPRVHKRYVPENGGGSVCEAARSPGWSACDYYFLSESRFDLVCNGVFQVRNETLRASCGCSEIIQVA